MINTIIYLSLFVLNLLYISINDDRIYYRGMILMWDKSRKLLIVKLFSFLFLFIAIFSINYYSKALSNGNKFILDEVTILEKAEDVMGNVINNNDNEINTDIEFHKLDDYIVYNLTIKNVTNDQLTIKSITDDNNDQYIDYLYTESIDKIIEPDESFDLVIKAIYNNEQNDINNRDYNSNVKFILNYLDNNEEESEMLPINPNTSDNIYISFTLFLYRLLD